MKNKSSDSHEVQISCNTSSPKVQIMGNKASPKVSFSSKSKVPISSVSEDLCSSKPSKIDYSSSSNDKSINSKENVSNNGLQQPLLLLSNLPLPAEQASDSILGYIDE